MLGVVLLVGCTAGVSADPPHVFPGGYERLSDAGLYADIEAKEIAPGLVSFTPRFAHESTMDR